MFFITLMKRGCVCVCVYTYFFSYQNPISLLFTISFTSMRIYMFHTIELSIFNNNSYIIYSSYYQLSIFISPIKLSFQLYTCILYQREDELTFVLFQYRYYNTFQYLICIHNISKSLIPVFFFLKRIHFIFHNISKQLFKRSIGFDKISVKSPLYEAVSKTFVPPQPA